MHARRLLFQVGSFLLAGILLYLALRGVDLGEVLAALAGANYVWLLPLVAVVFLSHLARAWRWQMLLKALPEAAGTMGVRTIRNAFGALMIGYMVNYAAPRLGEVARSVHLSAQERLSFSGVFGTVVVDRILDVVVLGVALMSVALLLFDRFATIERVFIDPVAAQLGNFPVTLAGILSAGLAVLVVALLHRALRREESALRRFWIRRGAPLLTSFRHGLMTVFRSRERGSLVLSTAAMWFLYVLMAYLPFEMLGMAEAYGLSLVDTWSIMVIGSLGVVIPSPGGIGSYHYITVQTLVHLFAVDAAAAATYAVLTHAAQLVLYVAAGVAVLLVQGSGFRALRTQALAAQQENPT